MVYEAPKKAGANVLTRVFTPARISKATNGRTMHMHVDSHMYRHVRVVPRTDRQHTREVGLEPRGRRHRFSDRHERHEFRRGRAPQRNHAVPTKCFRGHRAHVALRLCGNVSERRAWNSELGHAAMLCAWRAIHPVRTCKHVSRQLD